mmetsp:Transcript_11596/g.45060  ORF Transcript_11596/g.45060 Transcript_11596/m.45060 type:complete len:420 (-) Transcript_11596:1487-2746(-)
MERRARRLVSALAGPRVEASRESRGLLGPADLPESWQCCCRRLLPAAADRARRARLAVPQMWGEGALPGAASSAELLRYQHLASLACRGGRHCTGRPRGGGARGRQRARSHKQGCPGGRPRQVRVADFGLHTHPGCSRRAASRQPPRASPMQGQRDGRQEPGLRTQGCCSAGKGLAGGESAGIAATAAAAAPGGLGGTDSDLECGRQGDKRLRFRVGQSHLPLDPQEHHGLGSLLALVSGGQDWALRGFHALGRKRRRRVPDLLERRAAARPAAAAGAGSAGGEDARLVGHHQHWPGAVPRGASDARALHRRAVQPAKAWARLATERSRLEVRSLGPEPLAQQREAQRAGGGQERRGGVNRRDPGGGERGKGVGRGAEASAADGHNRLRLAGAGRRLAPRLLRGDPLQGRALKLAHQNC